MTVSTPDPAWERRHPEGPETWSFDFVAPDGGLGGFVALTLWTAPRRAWYWAALVGRGRPYLLVRDLELAAPRSPASREIRGEGIWADVNCETPHDHWSLGLEAFGVSLDDPDEALGAERGDRTGLGLDLEWEADGPVVGDQAGYGQPCAVHGEILAGGGGGPVETIAFEGAGWRRHASGAGVDWAGPRWRLDGHLDDGGAHTAEGTGPAGVAVLQRAPLRLDGAVLERSLCRFRPPGAALGLGWSEHVHPAVPST
ncbi:MAG TPA: hypothetical protein VFJ85_19735 [Acidimicrobiales bacterium]|nr:hypothetical protein [Acidimicrobiales bacterium]